MKGKKEWKMNKEMWLMILLINYKRCNQCHTTSAM